MNPFLPALFHTEFLTRRHLNPDQLDYIWREECWPVELVNCVGCGMVMVLIHDPDLTEPWRSDRCLDCYLEKIDREDGV